MWNPRVAHYASLAVGFAVLLLIARNQWFFGDDWAILAPHLDAQVMQPHVGHWNLIPALVFQAVRNVVGLGSYLPYLLLAFAAHLTVAHLSWRILNRVGVPAWGATIAALLIVLLGAGAENILWAFQFGFMGAVALGLGLVILLDRAQLGTVRVVAVIALAILAPMFSGTFIPLLAAAAIVGLVRRGLLRTVFLFLPALAIYVTWYVVFALHDADTPTGVHTLAGAASALVYSAAMLAGGLGRALPWIGLGVIPAIAVAAWFVATVRRGFRSRLLPAYAMVVGSFVFVLLTAYARSGFGLSAAAAQRYAYVTVVLLIPALAVLVARLVAGRRRWRIAATSLAIALVVFNAGTLESSGEMQAAREQASRQRIESGYDTATTVHPPDAFLRAAADPQWAPDLTGADLRTLARWGQFDPSRN